MKIFPLAYNFNLIQAKNNNHVIKPLLYDSVSFSALKKTQFQGMDLVVVNQFKAPIQSFNSNDDFQIWCLDKINEKFPKYKEYKAKDDLATIQRSNTINEWRKYILEENDAYSNSVCLMILSSITKDLKENNNTIPPTLNKGVLAQTIVEIQEELKKDRNYQFNFTKLYQNNLRLFYSSDIEESTGETQTGWIVIPSYENDKENFKENVEKLKALSHPAWCTKSFNAEPYLKLGDFHIYLEEGKPKVGIRFQRDRIAEIQGEKNNGEIPLKYYSEIESHTIDCLFLQNMQNKMQTARVGATKIKNFLANLDKAIQEYSAREILELSGIEVEQDEDGKLIISEYKNPSPVFSYSDLNINEDLLFREIKEIKGNAIFTNSHAKNLGALEKIGGNASFVDSKIEDLGNLREIKGNADFFKSKIKSLKNLEKIGGNAIFESPVLSDIGNLKMIGGNAIFQTSSIKSLNKLQIIGGSAEISYSDLEDLGELEFVGKDLKLYFSKVADLKNLRFIGGNVEFKTINIPPKNLQAVGGSIDLKGSAIESLGSIKAVGRDIKPLGSVLEDLGELEYLGGKLKTDRYKYFDENQIQKAQSNPAGMQIIENLKSSLFELLNQV